MKSMKDMKEEAASAIFHAVDYDRYAAGFSSMTLGFCAVLPRKVFRLLAAMCMASERHANQRPPIVFRRFTLGSSGGAYGARTRNLRRDRAAL